MTLIELLFCYRDEVDCKGRFEADDWLYNSRETSIFSDGVKELVQANVDDDGEFIEINHDKLNLTELLRDSELNSIRRS